MMTAENFEKAYNKGFHQTARFLASRGLSPDGAEEIAQAAWAKGWERRAQLRNPSALSYWVNTIALNIWRQQLARRPVPRTLESIEEPQEKLQVLNARLDAEKLARHADPEGFRLLCWQAVMGFTSKEIAKKTGSTPIAVRVRMMRFKQRLRERALNAKRPHRRYASDNPGISGLKGARAS